MLVTRLLSHDLTAFIVPAVSNSFAFIIPADRCYHGDISVYGLDLLLEDINKFQSL